MSFLEKRACDWNSGEYSMVSRSESFIIRRQLHTPVKVLKFDISKLRVHSSIPLTTLLNLTVCGNIFFRPVCLILLNLALLNSAI